MVRRASVFAFLGGIAVVLASGEGRADQQQVLDQMVALNKSGVAAFTAGDVEQAKNDLLEAVVLGKQNALALHPVMARTYLHLGVVQVDGAKDREKGERYFVMALKIRPDIELTPALASKTVTQAFGQARTTSGITKSDKPAADKAVPEEAAEEPPAEEVVKSPKERRAEEAAAKKAELAAAKERKAEEAAAKKAEEAAAKEAAKERRAEEAANKDRERKAQEERAEKEKVVKELARDLQQARDTARKDAADKEKLQKEKQEKEKQLADLKAQTDKERQEKDKLIAELKAQLARETGTKDKLLAESKDRERKEREAREKQEKDKQAAEARERERKSKEQNERAEREKIAAGPDLPSHIPQKVFCPAPDESPAGKEVFVHCVAQPNVKGKAAVLYYRTSGLAHFNSLVMERSKKGWWMAAIPAAQVTGKILQYYVEIRGGDDHVTATNGKAKLPNIMSLRPAVAH
jgi:hypothetical protein